MVRLDATPQLSSNNKRLFCLVGGRVTSLQVCGIEKETNMAEREKAEDVFPNLLDEKQHFFQIHHNRQAKNAKTGETIFLDTET